MASVRHSCAWEGHLGAEGAEKQPVPLKGKQLVFQQRWTLLSAKAQGSWKYIGPTSLDPNTASWEVLGELPHVNDFPQHQSRPQASCQLPLPIGDTSNLCMWPRCFSFARDIRSGLSFQMNK